MKFQDYGPGACPACVRRHGQMPRGEVCIDRDGRALPLVVIEPGMEGRCRLARDGETPTPFDDRGEVAEVVS